jgi:ABC-type phosphate/phosphonate transport system permease subunit
MCRWHRGAVALQPERAWLQVSLIMLVILATVAVNEWVSAKLRHAIL